MDSWIAISPLLMLQFLGENIDNNNNNSPNIQLRIELMHINDKGDIVLSDPNPRDGDRTEGEGKVYGNCIPLCTPIEFRIPWGNLCNNGGQTDNQTYVVKCGVLPNNHTHHHTSWGVLCHMVKRTGVSGHAQWWDHSEYW